mgnify:CR=1 FL=1
MADSARLLELKRRPKRSGEASFFFYDPTFAVEACKVLPGGHGCATGHADELARHIAKPGVYV